MCGIVDLDPPKDPKVTNVVTSVGRQRKKTTNDATVIFVGVLKGSAVSRAHSSQK
jgi:hypoxanthine-guanine phosphoribosyltransferase